MEQKLTNGIMRIAVLGAGTMGPGIAQTYAMGGYAVDLWTREETAFELDKARVTLANSLDTFVQEGLLSRQEADETFSRVRFVTNLEETVRGAQFIQETIVENAKIKTSLYQQLVPLMGPDKILASNTSALNVFELAPAELLPQMLICHWYAPPQVIPLVEVVKSEQAPQEMAETAVALLRSCGKTAVLMKKFIRGYIINRLQQCIQGEVFNLIDGGYCDAQAIDDACKASFIPRAMVLGICKRIDFGGIDMTANNIRNKSYSFPSYDTMPRCMQEHLDRGELGVKTGKGFYDYSGKDMEALTAHRDKQLFKAFALAKEFMDDPV